MKFHRRCYFAEDGEEMYQNVNARAERFVFSLITPVVLWRSRCRCRPRCLSSLVPTFRTFVLSQNESPSLLQSA